MHSFDDYKRLNEEKLNELFNGAAKGFALNEIPELLSTSMSYSLMAGGKRLRPCMLLAACEMFGGDIHGALDFACAIEMIHTYSLIHDDLPGMDNDTLRRGRPTNHVVYGEGQAILAGDGLLNYAFEIMLKASLADKKDKLPFINAMNAIARGAGVSGMIAGQCADLYAENKACDNAQLLTYIHLKKTAAMFKGAVTAGAYLGGADEKAINALSIFSDNFGQMFQVTDDILDVTAEEGFGKSKGKDAEEGKLTAVSVYGLEGAKELAEKLTNQALNALADFDEKADCFRLLTRDMYSRKH